MADNFLPNRDADLLAWSANFTARIQAWFGSLGITEEQSARYAELHGVFAAALTKASDPATRTRGAVSAKNDSRHALKAEARVLARLARAQPTVTAAQRIGLGLAVRLGGGAAASIGAPRERPSLGIVHTSGRRVRVKLRRGVDADGASPDGRGRPDGAAGAVIFSFVGAAPPAELSAWRFERCTSRTSLDVQFDAGVAPGSKVHLAAFWYNPRGDRGPMSVPASTYVGDGVAGAAAA